MTLYEPNAPYPNEIKENIAWARRVLKARRCSLTERLMAGALIETSVELARVRALLRGQERAVRRSGAVQIKNPITGTWTKRDDKSGKFVDVKVDPKPFKGVRKRGKVS